MDSSETQNLASYVLSAIATWGDDVAQIDAKTGRSLSYKDVTRMANSVACKIKSEDIKPGTVIAVLLENCLQYAGVLLGILLTGNIAALYSPSLTSRELEHSLSITKPEAIYSPKINPEQENVINKHSNIKVLTWSLDEIMKGKEMFQFESTNLQLPAILLSSSGSTGLPKAVCLSHHNMIQSIENISQLLMKTGEPALGLMPFFHAYGLGLMLMALCRGSPFVVMSKFTPQEFSSAVIDHKIKRLHIVPSLLRKMAKGSIEPNCLKCIVALYTGAGTVALKDQYTVLDMLAPGGKMYHSYGMTETTHIVTLAELNPDKPGSCGRLLKCIKAKLIDENGETISEGMGELCIKGHLVTYLGYYENTKATRQTFTSDGWLKTGDLALIDDDGYVFIIDRIKDIIKCQGYQVSVTEIEQIISEQPGVCEVAVVGVPHEIYGEVPRAFVVPDEKEKPLEEQITEAIKKELSYYKWLKGGIRFVESLPKTHSMKIMRKELRKMS